MDSGPRRSRLEAAATRASATAEGNARLAGLFRAGKTVLGGRDGMISGTKPRLAPPFRRNQSVGAQNNAHVSGRGQGWSMNLRIQEKVKLVLASNICNNVKDPDIECSRCRMFGFR